MENNANPIKIDAVCLSNIQVIDIADMARLKELASFEEGNREVYVTETGQAFDYLEIDGDGYHLIMSKIKPRGVLHQCSRLDVKVRRGDGSANLYGYTLEEEFQRIQEVLDDLIHVYGVTLDLCRARNKYIELGLNFTLSEDEVGNQLALQAFADHHGDGITRGFYSITNSAMVEDYNKELQCIYGEHLADKQIEIKLYNKTIELREIRHLDTGQGEIIYRFEVIVKDDAFFKKTGCRSILECQNGDVLLHLYMEVVSKIYDNFAIYRENQKKHLVSIIEEAYKKNPKDYPTDVIAKIADYNMRKNTNLLLNIDNLFYALSQSCVARPNGVYDKVRCRQAKDRFRTVFRRNQAFRYYYNDNEPIEILLKKICLL